MFSEVENRQNINFILLPLAMESIHNSSNLFISYEELKEKYSDPENCKGIKFDFSMIESLSNP